MSEREQEVKIGLEAAAMAVGAVILTASCVKGRQPLGTGLGLGMIIGGGAAMVVSAAVKENVRSFLHIGPVGSNGTAATPSENSSA